MPILLELSRGMVSHILLFILGALQYTTLIFGFPSLCSLRQYELIMWQIDTNINLFCFSILQCHNNNTTNINNTKHSLNCISFLESSSSSSFDLSNLDVILLLFVNLVSAWFFPISSIICLSNLTTTSLFYTILGGIVK